MLVCHTFILSLCISLISSLSCRRLSKLESIISIFLDSSSLLCLNASVNVTGAPCTYHQKSSVHSCKKTVVSARCNVYISRLCHDASPSARLSVHLSVMEVHWRIIANLDFKFRSHFTAHWPPCCSPCCLRANHLALC